jgi:hypothetical protein
MTCRFIYNKAMQLPNVSIIALLLFVLFVTGNRPAAAWAYQKNTSRQHLYKLVLVYTQTDIVVSLPCEKWKDAAQRLA